MTTAEAGRLGGWIELLDRGNDLKVGHALGISVDHADRIGDMVRNPDLRAIRPDGNADRIDANGDTGDDSPPHPVDHIDRSGRGIDHIDKITMNHDG